MPWQLCFTEPPPQPQGLLVALRAGSSLQEQTQLSRSKVEGLGDDSGVCFTLPFPSRMGPGTCSDHTHELRAGSPGPLPSPTQHKQKQQNVGDEVEKEEERRGERGEKPP